MPKDDTKLFKQFSDNEGFRRWLTDTVFALTYSREGGQASAARVVALKAPNALLLAQ